MRSLELNLAQILQLQGDSMNRHQNEPHTYETMKVDLMDWCGWNHDTRTDKNHASYKELSWELISAGVKNGLMKS